MADVRDITLREFDATPSTIVLRDLPVPAVASTTIVLYDFDATPSTVILRDPTTVPSASFPTQYDGLRVYYGGSVRVLCLVAEVDAATGMGGVPKIRKGGTTYAIYLVDTTDPNASPVRIRTSTATRAVRVKT